MTTVPPAASLTRRLMRLSTIGEVAVHDNDDDPMGRWLEVSMTTQHPTGEVTLTIKRSNLSIAGTMTLSDLLPAVNGGASHEPGVRCVGSLGFAPRRGAGRATWPLLLSIPTGVDSELPDCFSSVRCGGPPGLLVCSGKHPVNCQFAVLSTNSGGDCRRALTNGYSCGGHLNIPIRAFERLMTAIHPRRKRRGILACNSYNGSVMVVADPRHIADKRNDPVDRDT